METIVSQSQKLVSKVAEVCRALREAVASGDISIQSCGWNRALHRERVDEFIAKDGSGLRQALLRELTSAIPLHRDSVDLVCALLNKAARQVGEWVRCRPASKAPIDEPRLFELCGLLAISGVACSWEQAMGTLGVVLVSRLFPAVEGQLRRGGKRAASWVRDYDELLQAAYFKMLDGADAGRAVATKGQPIGKSGRDRLPVELRPTDEHCWLTYLNVWLQDATTQAHRRCARLHLVGDDLYNDRNHLAQAPATWVTATVAVDEILSRCPSLEALLDKVDQPAPKVIEQALCELQNVRAFDPLEDDETDTYRLVVIDLLELEQRTENRASSRGVDNDAQRRRLRVILHLVLDGVSQAELGTRFGREAATIRSDVRIAKKELAALAQQALNGGNHGRGLALLLARIDKS